MIAGLRAQCNGPRDGALLRFSLGNALLEQGEHAAAMEEFRRAVAFDANYSAAWKLLGKACLASGDNDGAAQAWRSGIAVAQKRGDKQAEKEMTVFLRRLEKEQP
nr:tetratricopeptide repeat protein [Dyella mobilis]